MTHKKIQNYIFYELLLLQETFKILNKIFFAIIEVSHL